MVFTTNSPLHLLAEVALDTHTTEKRQDYDNTTFQNPEAGPSSLPYPIPTHHTRGFTKSLHIQCRQSDNVFACPTPKPLECSGTSNSRQDLAMYPSELCHNAKSKKRTSLRGAQKALKIEMAAKRREYKARALKIMTLDNSPVNHRQYILLRMVYDEITMYPSEAWMVLIALVIHRSFKQVKNWFGNERQKQKAGEMVWIHTDVGERIRMHPLVLQVCPDWSDGLFEGVLRILFFSLEDEHQF